MKIFLEMLWVMMVVESPEQQYLPGPERVLTDGFDSCQQAHQAFHIKGAQQ